MRCDLFLERYDAMDNRRRLGLRMRVHRSGCPSCRAATLAMEEALEGLRAESPRGGAGSAPEASGSARLGGSETAHDRAEERIMAAVRLLPRPRREVSVRNWVLSGFVIALSVALIPLGENFRLFSDVFGRSYVIPLFLVLAVVLTSYGALFIGSHVEELGILARKHGLAPGSPGRR